MTIRPGFFSANISGKQLGAPATTTANSGSSYVFVPSASTTTFGSITVTKKTTSPNGSWTEPTLSNNELTFNGSQGIAYLDNDQLHVAPPYSVQVDFYATQVAKSTAYIWNNGQGNGIGWPEAVVALNGSSLNMYTSSNSLGGTTYQARFAIKSNIQVNTWYRLGIMWYNTGGSNYVRFYLNGSALYTHQYSGTAFYPDPFNQTGGQNTSTSDGLPYNSGNGIAIGSDNANDPASRWEGKIRNVFVGTTLFWSI